MNWFEKLSKVVGTGVLVIAGIVVVSIILAFPTQLLWNWLMPILFGIKKITLIQALGVNLLSEILFGEGIIKIDL